MAMSSTVTFDIYRMGNHPPSPPNLTGQRGTLVCRFRNIKQSVIYTHILLVNLGVDIEDPSGTFGDTIYVPDKNGTPFTVVALERTRAGGADMKVAYLERQQPTWPTIYL
jgi:hypothetical protein